MIRKTISALTALMMLLTVLGAAAETAPEVDYTTGTPWLFVDLDGNVTEETDANLKDNFALGVNKAIVLKLEYKGGIPAAGIIEDIALQARADKARMFREGTPDSHDAKLAFDLYGLLTDWDSRNASGIAPLKEQTDEIERISSIEDLNRYFTEVPYEEQLAPDTLWSCGNESSMTDQSVKELFVSGTALLLEDSAEYTAETPVGRTLWEAKTGLARRMLVKLGYTEAEADAKIEACLSLEAMIAPSLPTEEDQGLPDFFEKINNHFTRDELAEACGQLPVIPWFEKTLGYPEQDSYNVYYPENLSKLAGLYTEENLELIKSYLIVHGVIGQAAFLDRECYEWEYLCSHANMGLTIIPKDADVFAEYIEMQLPWALERLYADTYLQAEDKERLTVLAKQMIAAWHQIIEEADFLSDETKAKAIEKLESIDLRILYPDDWTPYSYSKVNFRSAADGGTLYEAVRAIRKYNMMKKTESFSAKPEKGKWSLKPSSINCNYSSSDNSVFIGGGFARGEMYNSGMTDEEIMGKIGFFVAHEISHAFDRSGADTDKDGNRVQWWKDEELAVFSEKNQRLADYFSAIHPWEGISWNGETKTGEACADMGAMKCLLLMAKEKEDFDYDLFFRSFAGAFVRKVKLEPVYADFQNVHPLNYLRINTTLQQYDEFLDFYGIKEGDGMYLAPEDRVNIW